MSSFNDARIRLVNGHQSNLRGDFVLYWMQAYRRLGANHALDHALHLARSLRKPLVAYEGLRIDYPWASARLHRFMIDGMVDNAKTAKRLGINYWPYVETPDQSARGLLQSIAKKACAIITDDYPAFIVPGQIASLARKIDIPLIAVDGNGIVPLKLLGAVVSACAHLRPRIHRLFAEAWQHRAVSEPDFPAAVRKCIEPPFKVLDVKNLKSQAKLDQFMASLPIDQSVSAVAGMTGGTKSARECLDHFIQAKLPRYSEERNQPSDPESNASSGLSPWLRHGHLSIQSVAEAVMGKSWSPHQLNQSARGKREGYFHPDPNVNSFLDEAITWRDVGYHWHFVRNTESGIQNAKLKQPKGWDHPAFHNLESTLPMWAKATLSKHARDRREHVYSLEEWEAAATHDPLWNAAQTELTRNGRIHNYLRMLWGKKVLEWSASPEEAYLILEHLNNKYALDGRDPNSYTGILWCFGLFDRPWPPERKVFGHVRYMSSENTARKFKLMSYYDYVNSLPQ